MSSTRGPKKNTSRGTTRTKKTTGTKTTYKKPVREATREDKPFSKKPAEKRSFSKDKPAYGKTSASSFKKDRFDKDPKDSDKDTTRRSPAKKSPYPAKTGSKFSTGSRTGVKKTYGKDTPEKTTTGRYDKPAGDFKRKPKPSFKKEEGAEKTYTKRPAAKKTYSKDAPEKSSEQFEKPAAEFKRKAKPLYKKEGDPEKGFVKRTSTGKEKMYNLDSGKPFKPAYQKKNEDGTITPKKKVYKKEFVQWEKPSKKYRKLAEENAPKDGQVRLNKFIANAGICSRREADTLIETGVITVNGQVVTELGFKVGPEDKVVFGDRPVRGEKAVYILMNKPKDHITSSKDPQNRRTVIDLLTGVKERVFPVGRLDRNTTGVLLLTNDGEMADKLVHPRKSVTKMYHAELDKKFTAADMDRIKNGVELLDGFFQPDVVEYVDGLDKKHIGLEIHSGKNRIVRRLFEALGYEVIKLDRIIFAGLTKKGLTRGKWRFLKEQEVHALKML